MLPSRRFQALYSLGLEFWLPLPLLGLFFWVGGGVLTEKMLSRSYISADHLQSDKKLEVKRSKTVLLIQVEINSRRGFSRVKVKTANSALKELEFEFPVTQFFQIEAAIGRELGLSDEYVRKLVRYQIMD